jgi:hypothetical protein
MTWREFWSPREESATSVQAAATLGGFTIQNQSECDRQGLWVDGRQTGNYSKVQPGLAITFQPQESGKSLGSLEA